MMTRGIKSALVLCLFDRRAGLARSDPPSDLKYPDASVLIDIVYISKRYHISVSVAGMLAGS